MLTRAISLTYLLLVCVSCGPTLTSESTLKGKFSGEHYYDTNGWFCVEIKPSFRYQVQEHATDGSSAVSFQDDMGGLIRFEVIPIPDACLDEEKNRFDSNPAFYKAIFFESCFPEIVSSFPGTTVLHEEIVRDKDENQVFFLLDIPGGGTLVDNSTGKRTDSLRGYLMFLSRNHLVVESFQYPQIAVSTLRECNQKGDSSFFANTLRFLQEYRQGYRNLGSCK